MVPRGSDLGVDRNGMPVVEVDDVGFLDGLITGFTNPPGVDVATALAGTSEPEVSSEVRSDAVDESPSALAVGSGSPVAGSAEIAGASV